VTTTFNKAFDMKNTLLFIFMFAFALSITAQDIHFSQYYASPLTLNPALVGKFDGVWRATAIYRGQWFAPKDFQPYSTVSGSVDFALLRDKMKGNTLGVGLVVANDMQNFRSIKESANPQFVGQTNTINHTKIGLALGYMIGFGKEKKTQLSIGLTPQIEFTRLNFNYLFEQGFNPDLTYDPTRSGESLAFPSTTRFNMSAGLFFNTKPLDWLTFYAGYSMFNIARPNDHVLSTGTDYKRPFRHAASAGFEFEIKNRWVLIPGAYFQYMAKATETDFGLTAGYHFLKTENKNGTVFLGLWNRFGRDIIPKVGIEYNKFRFGAAFDVRLSQLQKDSKAAIASSSQPLAFELSLSYIGGISRVKENNYLFNPRY